MLVHSIHRLHILVLLLSYIERVPSNNYSTDDIPNIGRSIKQTKANHYQFELAKSIESSMRVMRLYQTHISRIKPFQIEIKNCSS